MKHLWWILVLFCKVTYYLLLMAFLPMFGTQANSVVPVEILQYVASHSGLYCFLTGRNFI